MCLFFVFSKRRCKNFLSQTFEASGVEKICQKVLCWCVKRFIMMAFYFGLVKLLIGVTYCFHEYSLVFLSLFFFFLSTLVSDEVEFSVCTYFTKWCILFHFMKFVYIRFIMCWGGMGAYVFCNSMYSALKVLWSSHKYMNSNAYLNLWFLW